MTPIPIEQDTWWYQECVIRKEEGHFIVYSDESSIGECYSMENAKKIAEKQKIKNLIYN